MNKCMCASIICLHRIKPCSRSDVHCGVLSSSTSLLSWSLVCTFMHINIKMLLCVVVQYDSKEQLIKFSLGVSVSVFPANLKLHSCTRLCFEMHVKLTDGSFACVYFRA